MLVGVDFDNTIVCYDGLFHRIAVEKGLVPAGVPMTKEAVRDYLRRVGREDDWTALQGLAYGPGMRDAAPFPGVCDFFTRCRQRGVAVRIISHRTRRPFLGPPYNLHQAAHDWLAVHGFCGPGPIGLTRAQVHLELTKADKLKRIALAGCDWFIDDLPEFLGEPAFPPAVGRIHFQPAGPSVDDPRWRRAASWLEIEDLLLCPTRQTA